MYPNLDVEFPLLSETLVIGAAAAMILLALRFATRRPWGGPSRSAPCAGCSPLVRAEQVLLVGLLIVPLALCTSDQPLRNRLARLAAALGMAILVIAPWAIYDMSRYQKPTLLTTNFGGAIRNSNCDDRLPRSAHRLLEPAVLSHPAAHRCFSAS